jgi:hypothetical protein
MNCPQCKAEVPSTHLNIQTDLGQCLQCNHIFKISEHIDIPSDDPFDMQHPPQGAWIRQERNDLVFGATTRSPLAFFLVPFMLVWSGGSLGGIYGYQLISGEFNLLLSLFGIPFLLGSVLFWSLALMAIWGKVEVTVDKNRGKIFTGIGTIGRSSTFEWDDIASVKEKESAQYKSRNTTTNIVLEGKKRISFGTGLNSSRQYYVFRTLKEIHSKVKNRKSF